MDKFFGDENSLIEKATETLFGLRGKKVNIKKAYEYFSFAAKKGSENAKNSLELFFKSGLPELNEETERGYEALRKFRLDVEAGVPSACFLWGVGKLTDDASDYMYHKGLSWVKQSSDAGFAPAQAAYADVLLNSNRVPRNHEEGMRLARKAAEQDEIRGIKLLFLNGAEKEAIEHLNRLAEKDTVEALMLLGEVYMGYGEPILAFPYYERAAALGNSDAMFNIGVFYQKGELGEDPDPFGAAFWYKKAIDNGSIVAMNNYAQLLESAPEPLQNFSEAFKWHLKSAEAGMMESWLDVATCYKYGRGTEQSFEKTKECYEKAFSIDEPERAYFNLFLLYRDGVAIEPNYEEALKWLRKAADQGLPIACWHLGMHYKHGINVPQNFTTAYSWFNKAAEKGLSEAIYEIGLMYRHGVVVAKDYKRAFEFFEKASSHIIPAMGQLGKCYSEGIGCEKDVHKAFECYRMAAEAGDAEAQYDLAICFRHGESVPQNIPEAIKWYEKAIAQGHSGAMSNLGILYDNGIGVEKDFERAFELYKMGAETGNYQAQFCLGSMYFHGRPNVEKDYEEAVKWFKMAADQGEPDSMFHLFICYNEGLGVERDYQKTLEYLFAAAERGWQPAIQVIRENNLQR